MMLAPTLPKLLSRYESPSITTSFGVTCPFVHGVGAVVPVLPSGATVEPSVSAGELAASPGVGSPVSPPLDPEDPELVGEPDEEDSDEPDEPDEPGEPDEPDEPEELDR